MACVLQLTESPPVDGSDVMSDICPVSGLVTWLALGAAVPMSGFRTVEESPG